MSHTKDFISDHTPEILGVGAVTVVLGMLGVALWCDAKEAAEWSAFKTQHACHIAQHAKSKTGIGVGPVVGGKGGVTIVSTVEPAQDGWLCDDGVTYWREAE